MHRHHTTGIRWTRALCAASLVFVIAPAWALPPSETLTAQATVKTAGGATASAPVTVVVDRFATDADRAALKAALARGGTAAARAWLARRGDAGTVQVGARRTAIKFASRLTTAAGHLITVVTAEPIVFLGAGLPDAKPRAGYDLGFATLEVAASGPGVGELLAATKIRFDEQGAIATEDYSGVSMQLSNVVRK